MGPFSIHILEQEGYISIGMFLMSFSNMCRVFSIQYVIPGWDAILVKRKGKPFLVYFWEGIFPSRGMLDIQGLCRYGFILQTLNQTSG